MKKKRRIKKLIPKYTLNILRSRRKDLIRSKIISFSKNRFSIVRAIVVPRLFPSNVGISRKISVSSISSFKNPSPFS